MKNNKQIRMAELEHKIRSCAFNEDGSAIACGLSDGTLVVVKTQ